MSYFGMKSLNQLESSNLQGILTLRKSNCLGEYSAVFKNREGHRHTHL